MGAVNLFDQFAFGHERLVKRFAEIQHGSKGDVLIREPGFPLRAGTGREDAGKECDQLILLPCRLVRHRDQVGPVQRIEQVGRELRFTAAQYHMPIIGSAIDLIEGGAP